MSDTTSSSPAASQAQERMLELKRRYIGQMADRIVATEAWLRTGADGVIADLNRQELVSQAHKFAGSGAMYGFPEISVAARCLEHALKAEPDLADDRVQTLARAMLDACEQARQAIGSEPPPAPEPEPLLLAPTPAAALQQALAAVAAHADARATASAAPSAEATPTQARKPTLLIVDDDTTVRDLLLSLFEDDAVMLARDNPSDAFEAMLSHRPDLVILDDNLLGANSHDGRMLVERMREHVELRSTPVIMLTGNAQPVEVLRGLAAGAADYVIKPFDQDELVRKIRRRLERLSVVVVIGDEDELLSDLLAQRFRVLGYRVLTCADGASLLDTISLQKVDLVILEWLMPRIDGLTLLQRMAQDPRLGRVPAIITSTRRRGDDMVEAFEAGASDYVAKPIRIDELMARSQRLLSMNRSAL